MVLGQDLAFGSFKNTVQQSVRLASVSYSAQRSEHTGEEEGEERTD
jgi:hypothetical protein